MVVVIFEVVPTEARGQEYFDLAKELRPTLEQIDGFISVERFESLVEKGKYLSLSTWRDEKAVMAWREHAEHRVAQREGKSGIFKSYRIRVASVIRDYGFEDAKAEAAAHSGN